MRKIHILTFVLSSLLSLVAVSPVLGQKEAKRHAENSFCNMLGREDQEIWFALHSGDGVRVT